VGIALSPRAADAQSFYAFAGGGRFTEQPAA
jgi:hypothetical protein